MDLYWRSFDYGGAYYAHLGEVVDRALAVRYVGGWLRFGSDLCDCQSKASLL